MSQLSESDRRTMWAEFMSNMSNKREGIALSKANLRAAVDAIDQWIDTNVASFTSALPQPSRTNLTAKQKLELFMAIAKKRWEVS